jgi:hypothetical protein
LHDDDGTLAKSGEAPVGFGERGVLGGVVSGSGGLVSSSGALLDVELAGERVDGALVPRVVRRQ